MDNKTFLVICIVLTILIIRWIYSVYAPKIKGAMGEHSVEKRLRRLDKYQYRVYNDIYLKSSNRSTQIDHLIISIYGIFVIETKNYNGWIHGHENSEYWTQSIFESKSKFRNPVKQNWAHIYFLKKVMADFPPRIFHPIVVFTGSATLKNVYANVPVIYKHELLRTIKQYNTRLLTLEQVKAFENQLHDVQVLEKTARKEHKKYVKRNIRERKESVKASICPNCGGQLVIRKGRYGKFYGCSNYPKCKFSTTG